MKTSELIFLMSCYSLIHVVCPKIIFCYSTVYYTNVNGLIPNLVLRHFIWTFWIILQNNRKHAKYDGYKNISSPEGTA